MKLLYTGSHHCSLATLKHLLLLANEIAFVDRASVRLGNWGTVGTNSPIREIVPTFAGQPVKLQVHAAAISGPADQMVLGYIEADIANLRFREVFLRGLKSNAMFAEKFINSEAKYTDGPGAVVIEALTEDRDLLAADLCGPSMERPQFTIRDAVGRRDTLRTLLADASVRLTNAMLISASTGYAAVTDDPFLAELLTMRATDSSYVGGRSLVAPLLGLEVARAVIPDEALAKLTLRDILEYRKKARDAYDAWFVDINSLAAEVEEIPPAKMQRHLKKIVASSIEPRRLEYRREMESARDELFGDLVKTVFKWQCPTLSLGYICGLTFPEAILAFIAALGPAVTVATDHVLKTRRVNREHAVSYLVGVSDNVKIKRKRLK